MAAPRRKAPKQEAPQTIEEAVAKIAEYRDLVDKQEELTADASRSIALIETARDEFTAPVKARAESIFLQLRAWWSVAAPAMTEGKRKSVELAGCVIGERTTPPSLKHKGIKAADLIADLADVGMEELLKVTTKLDKPACIRAIKEGNELGQLLLWLGATNHQADEFFIDRAGKKAADTEIVEIPEAAE